MYLGSQQREYKRLALFLFIHLYFLPMPERKKKTINYRIWILVHTVYLTSDIMVSN